MNTTKWIDLTDLAVWSGHLTGIQRLVYQITLRYSEDENVRYFIFDEEKKKFFETSFQPIREQIEASMQNQEQQAVSVSRLSTAEIKQTAIRFYKKMPESLRDRFTPARKEKLKKLYKKSRQIAKKRPSFSKSKPNGHNEVIFHKGDTVLVMGKPWDYPSFMECIRRQKLVEDFKLIQVVYDLIPVFQPHLHGEALIKQYTQHMFEVAALSDGLLAISKSTKKDMTRFCKRLNLPVPPIEVIRLGDDFTNVAPKKPDYINLKTQSYILNVCTVEIRKNHKLLYLIYKQAEEKGIELPDLVLVGRPGWYTHDVLYEFTHDPATKNKVHILQNVDDAQLAWLYENCLFTVYPAIYEGWGLPIAESLLYKKVCVASSASSMTEIAGDLLEYHSPYDPDVLLALVQKYMNTSVRKKKELEISKNYKPTTWDQTFAQADKLINS